MADKFTGRVELAETKDGAERRRAPRLETAFDLSYQIVALPDEKTLLETLDKLLTGHSKDLSEVGISMWTNKLLMPGTTLEMQFPAQAMGEAPVKVKARVVWCQPHTEGGFVRVRSGLEFVDVDPDTRARLVRIIREGLGPTSA
ncbi:MAG: PilZ domain-containing protein [Candidatus Coatesbacteria bacterium]